MNNIISNSRKYGKRIQNVIVPRATVKVFRQSKSEILPNDLVHKGKKKRKDEPILESTSTEYRDNCFNIQMISKNLHEQIFYNAQTAKTPTPTTDPLIQQHVEDLKKHGIDIEEKETLPDVHLKLPPLHGNNIEEHFHTIAKEQIRPYIGLLSILAEVKASHPPPKRWIFREGWTQYDRNSDIAQAIDYPRENALVFDVEVCMSHGNVPTLATAVGPRYWYSWVSRHLIENNCTKSKYNRLEDLIPMGKEEPKIIVGHNVSYDRARIKEQYEMEDSRVRFMDTMSLHICISGITSQQRAIKKSKKLQSVYSAEWMEKSSLNSLTEVYKLYCNGQSHTKDIRNVFVKGSMTDVRADFQNLMTYCANDVMVTQKVFSQLYPMFCGRFPHPVTLVGMLELGSAYLPVNTNWLRYINEANLAYDELNIKAKHHLTKCANEACNLLHNDKYKEDLWLRDEDWSIQQLRIKKMNKQRSVKNKNADVDVTRMTIDNRAQFTDEESRLAEKFQYLYEAKALLPARRPFLPGYPAWYRKLYNRHASDDENTDDSSSCQQERMDIGMAMQITPKLLRLCWEGYPLHFRKDHGWGFLIPLPIQSPQLDEDADDDPKIHVNEADQYHHIHKGFIQEEYEQNIPTKLKSAPAFYKGSGIWCDTVLKDSYFFKLPHKDGPMQRVGNPLSKDFISKFSANVLTSGDKAAVEIIKIAQMLSYWRNNRDRITNQMVVWLPVKDLSLLDEHQHEHHNRIQYGAICPNVIVCGTLTRRAVESTWMTASNSQSNRIGSELRAMIQAPPSYRIVGADVDSQELWIASILGDAFSCGLHGATPLGWMTLSGRKANGTDMHSITAKAIGISRDDAKVLNYARIYGAGPKFAQVLLQQCNASLTKLETKQKALKMYSITKGVKTFRLRQEYHEMYGNESHSRRDAMKLATACRLPVDDMFERSHWHGGTESAMFNRLEEIAMRDAPKTPFLDCRLSRALEGKVDASTQILPTRVNWVVQSGAVDFLHLMLVCMRWLMGPHIRFCLSFHDELRYLTKDEMAYKVALAMHVANLLTRSFCSSRLALYDLPMSVAFFSSVEVDTVLRKDCKMDCKTPSNLHGLQMGYGIPFGESLNIYETLEKVKDDADMSQWSWIK